jgi:hypothetical protein
MSIFAGTTELANIYVGTTEIQDIYIGTTNVWTQTVAEEGRLFACDYSLDKAYEIDPDTLVVLNTSTTTYTGTPYGIGGIIDRLFMVENTNDMLYELDPDTLVSLDSASRLATRAGVGGTATKLYLNDDFAGAEGIWEVNPNTLLYSTKYAQSNVTPRGIGGTYDRLFSTGTSGGDYIYEHNTSTLAVTSTTLFQPAGYTAGGIRDIGGTNTRLYIVRSDLDRIYEIDPDTKTILNSSSASVIGGSPAGVGGIKVLI